jgi:hypothetical protein
MKMVVARRVGKLFSKGSSGWKSIEKKYTALKLPSAGFPGRALLEFSSS